MSEQREAIISLLDPIVGPAYASNAPEAADAVIQYLWQHADDPEVVEAVAKQLYRDTLRTSEFLVLPDGMSAWEVLPTQIKNEWKAMVRSTRASLLTALLGPRPSGEEAADER